MEHISSENNSHEAPMRVPEEQLLINPHKETLEMIERLDYGTLQDIFNELCARSGVNNPTRFIDKKNIKTLEENTSYLLGQYLGDGKMMLNPLEIAGGEAVGGYPETTTEMQRRALSVLVHEMTHGAGNNVSAGIFQRGVKMIISGFSDDPVVFQRNGLKRREYKKGEPSSPFKLVSEGVTDMIGEQVYGEYLKRTGRAAEVTDEHHGGKYEEAYPGSRIVITALIEMIAHASDIPSDKVWEGIISGYMNGIDLDDSELAPILNDVFYPEFIKQLKEAQLGEMEIPLPEILEKVKHAGLSAEARAKIADAVEKYRIKLKVLAAGSPPGNHKQIIEKEIERLG